MDRQVRHREAKQPPKSHTASSVGSETQPLTSLCLCGGVFGNRSIHSDHLRGRGRERRKPRTTQRNPVLKNSSSGRPQEQPRQWESGFGSAVSKGEGPCCCLCPGHACHLGGAIPVDVLSHPGQARCRDPANWTVGQPPAWTLVRPSPLKVKG